MRLLGFLLTLSVTAPAYAQVEDGSRCVLTAKIRMWAKPKARGKRSKLRKGTEIEVLRRAGRMVKVRAGRKKGFVKSRAARRLCEPVDAADAEATSPAAEPVAVQPDPAPAPAPERGAADTAFASTYKIKIAVLDLKPVGSIADELVASLTGVVPETLEALSLFEAISSQEIQQMLQYETDKQLLGCDDMTCIAEIGGALGADFFVTGSITSMEDKSVIQLQLANIGEAKVASRISREYEGDSQGLFDQLRAATRILVRDLLGERSGTLSVAADQEGASIKIDGAIVGVTPLREPLTLAGGSHELVVEKRQFVVSRQDIVITPERHLDLSVNLLPSAEFIADYEENASFTRNMAWVSLGAGAASLGGAAALYVAGQQQAEYVRQQTESYNASDNRSTERFERLNRLEEEVAIMDVGALVAASIGVVATGIGVTLLVIGDDPDHYDAVKTLRVGVVPLANGIGLAGSF